MCSLYEISPSKTRCMHSFIWPLCFNKSFFKKEKKRKKNFNINRKSWIFRHDSPHGKCYWVNCKINDPNQRITLKFQNGGERNTQELPETQQEAYKGITCKRSLNRSLNGNSGKTEDNTSKRKRWNPLQPRIPCPEKLFYQVWGQTNSISKNLPSP